MNNNETNEDIRVRELDRGVGSDCETDGEAGSNTSDKAPIRAQILQRAESIRASKPELDYERRYGYVYLTENLVNGKLYIGQHRAKELDINYKGSGLYIIEAIKKYGLDSFVPVVLEWCASEEELEMKEEEWIVYFNAHESDLFYNRRRGGSRAGFCKESRDMMSKTKSILYIGEGNPFYGKHHSEEVRRATSERDKLLFRGEGNPFYGKHHTDEAKKKISDANRGRKFTQEQIQHMSDAKLGHVHSEETKRKIGVAHKGRVYSSDSRANMGRPKGIPISEETKRKLSISCSKPKKHKTPVICVETGEVYDSVASAMKFTNSSRYDMVAAIKRYNEGYDRTCGGYHWKYVE